MAHKISVLVLCMLISTPTFASEPTISFSDDAEAATCVVGAMGCCMSAIMSYHYAKKTQPTKLNGKRGSSAKIIFLKNFCIGTTLTITAVLLTIAGLTTLTVH